MLDCGVVTIVIFVDDALFALPVPKLQQATTIEIVVSLGIPPIVVQDTGSTYVPAPKTGNGAGFVNAGIIVVVPTSTETKLGTSGM